MNEKYFNFTIITGNLAGLGGSLDLSIIVGGSAITFQRAAVVPTKRDHRFSSNTSEMIKIILTYMWLPSPK